MAEIIVRRVKDYENVIWDWNGTLLNDAHIGYQAETELFRRYGLKTQTAEERRKNFCMPIEVYYTRMGFAFSKVDYQAISDEWLSIYESFVETAPVFEGVSDMLHAIQSAGKKQFVLTAAPEVHVHAMTQKHGIHHYFDAVYGLANARADSKIERGSELIRDNLIDPDRTILIGDTTHDYEVGEALGTDVLLIADGHNSFEALCKVHHNVLPSRWVKP